MQRRAALALPHLRPHLTLSLLVCVFVCMCVQRFDEGGHSQYLVRWAGYGGEHDEWIPLTELAGCKELVQKFEKKLSALKRTTGEEPLGRVCKSY